MTEKKNEGKIDDSHISGAILMTTQNSFQETKTSYEGEVDVRKYYQGKLDDN